MLNNRKLNHNADDIKMPTVTLVLAVLALAPSVIPTASADFYPEQYVGCYQNDCYNRVLQHESHLGSQMTYKMCADYCRSFSLTFFGAEFGEYCFCGDQYERVGLGKSSNCYIHCAGDGNQICGGNCAMSVFWVCPKGYFGANCSNTCHCQNSGRYSNGCFFNGTCPEGCLLGWTGVKCATDIDECFTANGGCQHTCTNTVGSYYCSCMTGYTQNADNRTCTDNDECCIGNGGCQHNCTNTPGSYYCSCVNGFTVNNDSRSCTETDECTTQTHGCQQVCHNIPGSYTCSCRQGYLLNTDGRTCAEIDECLSTTHGCQDNCTNTPGSYRCSCRSGFSLDSAGRNCSDIDECATNTSVCPQQTAVCVNTVGSYRCLFENSEMPIQHTDKWPSGAIAAAIILGAAWLITLIIAVIVIAILVSKRRGNQNIGGADRVPQIYDTVDGDNENTAGAKTTENDNSYTEFTGSAVRMDKQEHAYEGLKM